MLAQWESQRLCTMCGIRHTVYLRPSGQTQRGEWSSAADHALLGAAADCPAPGSLKRSQRLVRSVCASQWVAT